MSEKEMRDDGVNAAVPPAPTFPCDTLKFARDTKRRQALVSADA